MLKLYKSEEWTKKNKKEGMRELTGGPVEEEEKPAKSKVSSSLPGFEPHTKQKKKTLKRALSLLSHNYIHQLNFYCSKTIKTG